MSLFKKKKLDKEPGMLTGGTILEPGAPDSASVVSYRSTPKTPSVNPSATSTQTATTNRKMPGKIDFAKNYDNWIISPILNDIYEKEIKIPTIQLKEYRLQSSTLWEQMKYFAYIFSQAPDRVGKDLRSVLGDNFVSEIAEGVQIIYDKAYSVVRNVLEGLRFDTPDFDKQSSKDPYEGLYNAIPTRFEYTFPLYTKDMKRKYSSFSDTYSTDGKGALAEFAENKFGVWNATANSTARVLVEPGIYTEKTQFYNFGQNLENISFSFPLLNTVSQDQINENYQFLFLILFQNSMFRKDRAAYIPPCLYEVLVPGIRYMKYAYISEIQIDFLGTRRMIEVDSGIGIFKTIIPEAYNVRLTINGMHEEAGNFLIRAESDTIDNIATRDVINY